MATRKRLQRAAPRIRRINDKHRTARAGLLRDAKALQIKPTIQNAQRARAAVLPSVLCAFFRGWPCRWNKAPGGCAAVVANEKSTERCCTLFVTAFPPGKGFDRRCAPAGREKKHPRRTLCGGDALRFENMVSAAHISRQKGDWIALRSANYCADFSFLRAVQASWGAAV